MVVLLCRRLKVQPGGCDGPSSRFRAQSSKVTQGSRLRAEGRWNLGQKDPDLRWRKKLVEIQDEVSGFRGGGRYWFGIWGSWELESEPKGHTAGEGLRGHGAKEGAEAG